MKTGTTFRASSSRLAVLAAGLGLAPFATAQEADQDGWIPLFNGQNLDGWKLKQDDEAHRATWTVVSSVKLDPDDPQKLIGEGDGSEDSGVLFRQPIESGSDLFTERTFGDGELKLEFMVPKGSNSGIYLMGQYEVQVLDSFGKPDDDLGQGDVGAIYSASAPSSNAAKEPGEWQTFHIVYEAPRFDDDGNKTQNAKVRSVILNGTEIQKDVEVSGSTGGELPGGEKPEGPLMIQGDHGIVALRNIRFKPAQE